MILTKTPLRVSFLGGGTDFREYYSQNGGCVLTTAITVYVHVAVQSMLTDTIVVDAACAQSARTLEEVRHDLIRECLRKAGCCRRISTAATADLPGNGMGLGASSALAVGLLHAFYTMRGVDASAERLAKDACDVEIGVLRKPIGIQDQYIAAYGGQRLIRFGSNGDVDVQPLALGEDERSEFERYLMLFFVGPRPPNGVLHRQLSGISRNRPLLDELRDLVPLGARLLRRGEFDAFGRLLHHAWEIKKGLAVGMSNATVDDMYQAARRSGALGGKICGAGGGGCLLICCPPGRRAAVRAALRDCAEIPFHLEPHGSSVQFHEEQSGEVDARVEFRHVAAGS